MEHNFSFGIILDFIVVTPFLMLLRAVFPFKATLQLSFLFVAVYCIYTVAPRFILFYLLFWIIVWAMQYLVASPIWKEATTKYCIFLTSILITLSPLIVWKIFPEFFVQNVTNLLVYALFNITPSLIPIDTLASIIAPIGLSFAVFRALDLIIKVRLNILPSFKFVETLFFGLFVPVLTVGPVIEPEEVRITEKRIPRFPAASDLAIGISRVSIGFIKIGVLTPLLLDYVNGTWNGGELNVIQNWLCLFVFGIFFYINFSGFSDIAIGLSRVHGFKLKENFNNPYFKTNPQEFWANWHMSLTRWCQRYVFIPMGGMRKKKQYIAGFATILVIALWHDISINMIIFGTYQGLLLTGHRFLMNRRLSMRKEVSKNKFIIGLKMFAVFTSQCLAYPLFTLNTAEIPAFYFSLLGL